MENTFKRTSIAIAENIQDVIPFDIDLLSMGNVQKQSQKIITIAMMIGPSWDLIP